MPILFLSNISKKFDTSTGDFFALQNINLDFSNKGFVAITGKSGSGKSTLLNLILGIEKPTTGKILFNNQNIAKFKDKDISNYRSKDISVIFQHYNLFSNMTAIDNVITPLLIRGENKTKSIESAKELFNKFNMSYLMDKKIDKLSGGEKQRIAIIRALLTNPRVILCDEPTGALDEENSKFVMEILKDISKQRLVVIVSHNSKLVERYCDRIIELEDGFVIKDENTLKDKDEYQYKTNRISRNNKWTSLFVRRHFKNNLTKNLLSIFSTSFGLLCTLVAVGFNDGIEKTSELAIQNNLAITTAMISEKQFIDIENSPLQYEKSVRPEPYKTEFIYSSLPSASIEPNISYFIPSVPTLRYNKEVLNGVSFIPIYEESYFSDYKDIIINDKCLELLNITKDVSIDETIRFSYEVQPSVQTGDNENPVVKDVVNITMDLTIKNTIEEFSFLNTPKIYYSYQRMLEYLQTISLDNLSNFYGYKLNAFDYLISSKADSLASSYSNYLFIKDINEVTELFKLKERLDEDKNSIRIDSDVYSIKETYVTFMTSFSSSLEIFIIISFVGVSFILGICSLSSFISHKKESAILTILGSRNGSIINIFLNESMLVVFTSIFIAFALSYPTQILVNKIVKSLAKISNIISIPYSSFLGIPYLLPIGIIIATVLVAVIFVLTPLLIYKKISLSDELKDE